MADDVHVISDVKLKVNYFTYVYSMDRSDLMPKGHWPENECPHAYWTNHDCNFDSRKLLYVRYSISPGST